MMPTDTENMDRKDDLLINYLLKETSSKDTIMVKEWLQTDQYCQTSFEQFQLLWGTSRNLSDDTEIDPKASLLRFKERVIEQRKNHAKRKWARYTWIVIAASLLLFAGCPWAYFSFYMVSDITLVTQTQTRTVTLSDSSIITLNRSTVFEYPSTFGNSQREVELKNGEAFFKVTHNAAKPFKIHAGTVLINVMGTSFNVKNKAGNVEVIVETGVVRVIRGRLSILLKPSEKVVIKSETSLLKKETTQIDYTSIIGPKSSSRKIPRSGK
jgi:ferric-dicitrate binding protein FerR (iron transport regulator)